MYVSYNLECTGLEPSIVDCDVTEVVGECFYGYLTAECKLLASAHCGTCMMVQEGSVVL